MKENTVIAIIMICVTILILLLFLSKPKATIDNSANVDSLINEVSDLQSRVKYLEFRCDSIIKEDW